MQLKIVIGYVDSPQGHDAIALGRALAELLRAKPLVATVFPWPEGLLLEADADSTVRHEADARFEAACKLLPGLEPETREIADESSARGLSELATEELADLIVIGSSHRGPIGRTLLGSAARSLLSLAPCAVAVAPVGFAESDPEVRRVGVAFDGSAESRAALRAAVELAGRAHAEMTIIGVADYPSHQVTEDVSDLTARELREFERERRTAEVDGALASVPETLPAEGRVLTGSAGPLLCEASEDFDLFVIGSRGYGPLRSALLGSTSHRLIASSRCPVLVLPREVAPGTFDASDRESAIQG